MMKSKWIVLFIIFGSLTACSPGLAEPEPEIESRPTTIPTALAQATKTAVNTPTAVPSPTTTVMPTPMPILQATPTPVPLPETAVSIPRFDRHLPLARGEQLTGLIWTDGQWQLVEAPFPPNIHATDSDYAQATDRLLAWSFQGGGGPGQLAVGALSIVDVGTGAQEVVIASNMVSAGWAPNGQDFAYILATPNTYELRWRTAVGEDRLLAVDVPHTLRVSPDGRYVAFTRESHYEVDGTPPGLYVVEIETGIETQLSTLNRAGYGGIGHFWKPHWSPDSSQLLLYATANDDRTDEPFPSGYVWAAMDGSFSYFFAEADFLALVDYELSDLNNFTCLGAPPVFAAYQIVLPVGECQPMTGGDPGMGQPAHFRLDSESGVISWLQTVDVPQTAELLAWDVVGESILLRDRGEMFSHTLLATQ